MADHVLKTLEDLKKGISSLEAQLNEKKKMANYLSGMAGNSDIYAVQSNEPASVMPSNGDEYYGMPAVTAIREVLNARKSANIGPATLGEIYDTLIAGGYHFDTATETNARNSLRVTLSKRSATFHKIPNGKYGLVKWYEKIKVAKKSKKARIDEDEDGLEKMDEEFGDSSTTREESVEA